MDSDAQPLQVQRRSQGLQALVNKAVQGGREAMVDGQRVVRDVRGVGKGAKVLLHGQEPRQVQLAGVGQGGALALAPRPVLLAIAFPQLFNSLVELAAGRRVVPALPGAIVGVAFRVFRQPAELFLVLGYLVHGLLPAVSHEQGQFRQAGLAALEGGGQ